MSRRPRQILSAALLALCLTYVAGALTVYPSLFPDPAYGLLVQKSMQAGAPWNHVTEPRPDDISRDHTYFHTMWSPGQHVLPGALMAAGATLGGALRTINVLAALAGIAGWYGLFRALRFEAIVALGACLVMAASRTFSFSFLAYVGSDQLAFAAFPWLAWLVLRVRDGWLLVAVAPAAILAGFFLKNSMAIYVTAWVGAVVLAQAWLRPFEWSRSWPRLAAVSVAAGAAIAVIDWGYVSRGWTPMTYQPTWSREVATYLLPAAMPILAGTGFDDLLSRAFDHPEWSRVDYKASVLLLAPIVAGVVTWAIAEWRHTVHREVRIAIVTFVAATVTVFTYLLATGSGASVYLSRHYVIPGALLLPLLIARLPGLRSRFATAGVILALLLPAGYGVASFGANWRRHYVNRAAHSSEVQVAHLPLTPRVIQHLRTLDRELPAGSSLVVLPIPSLAFEFSRTRVLATSATSDGIPEFTRSSWRGRVATLVVVAEQAGQTPQEVAAWLASFRDYDASAWQSASVDGFSFYVPDGQAIDRTWLEDHLAGPADGS